MKQKRYKRQDMCEGAGSLGELPCVQTKSAALAFRMLHPAATIGPGFGH